MKNHPLIRVILTGIAALAASSTWADTLVLRSGETLSGELLDISDGTLTFVTTLSGQMMVPTEEVESIATGSYMRVSLAEGPPMAGRFVVSGGTTRIRRKDGTLTNSLNLASVTSATPLTNEDELTLRGKPGFIGAQETQTTLTSLHGWRLRAKLMTTHSAPCSSSSEPTRSAFPAGFEPTPNGASGREAASIRLRPSK